MPYWQDQFSTGYRDSTGHLNVTASQSATIVSILSAGTFFGALTAAPVGDLIGRRFGLIVSTFVFILGVILQAAATQIPLFVAGRFFAGFGVGLISALSKWPINWTSVFSIAINIIHSPPLPVRNGSEMDPRSDCWVLPTCYYHRPPLSLDR